IIFVISQITQLSLERDWTELRSISRLLWRALINYTLREGLAARYVHAAEHLLDCGLLDAQIADYGHYQTHQSYFHALEIRHDRKSSFWSKISSAR
ncbi:MAG: DUF6880 family protein, partial [Planktotalea arctica]